MGSELLISDLPKEKYPQTKLFWGAYPAYLAMGMPPQEYWDGDAQSCVAYRKAYEERLELQDAMLWRQGLYVYHAMCAVAPYFNSIKPQKPESYIEKPFSITQKEKAEEEARTRMTEKERNFKAIVEAWAVKVNSMRKQNNGT